MSLVLSRKLGTEVVLHEGGRVLARVRVVRIEDKVRLAFDAPPSVEIDRGEVYEAKQEWRDAADPRCPRCGVEVNVLGRSADGRLHPGKRCAPAPAPVAEGVA